MGYLGERAALADAGVPEHLSALISEVLTATWGMSQGCSRVAQSRRGSRPGDPLADAIFGFIFGRCRKRARNQLRAEGLLSRVPWSGHHHFEREGNPGDEQQGVDLAEVAYADDAALPVVAPAAAILGMTAAAGAIVLRGMWGHGWTPNLGPGKTEAIIRIVGIGSVECSRRLAFDLEHRLRLAGGAAEGHDLRIVHAYRHLGTVVAGNGSMNAELSARRNAAARERRSMETYFRDAGASVQARLQVVRQVGVSILTSNAGTWPALTPALQRILQIELEAWVRAALGKKRGPSVHIAFDLLRAEHCIEDVGIVVRGLRLRYFRRLVVQGPDAVWALLQQCPPVKHGRGRQGNWAGALREDLIWAKAHSRKLGELPGEDNFT